MKLAESTTKESSNPLTSLVEDTLLERGYQFVNKNRFRAATYLEQPIYSKHVNIAKSIYRTPMNCHFVVYHPHKHPDCLVVESKWQKMSGSVDEKFPYLVSNIKEKYPYSCIILLDGGGYRKGAEKWLRDQVGSNLLNVFSRSEFTDWASAGGL